jgi:hypothetical protein
MEHIQQTSAKLLSLGFKEKTYDGQESTFISLTQSYGNTPFFNPSIDVDYEPLLGKLVTMELTPEGDFQVGAIGDNFSELNIYEGYTSNGMSPEEALELVVAYYEKTKPLTNMRWCYIDENGIVTPILFTVDNSTIRDDFLVNVATGNKMVLASTRTDSCYVLVDKLNYVLFKCKPEFDEYGLVESIQVGDEYTLFASMKDVSLSVEIF